MVCFDVGCYGRCFVFGYGVVGGYDMVQSVIVQNNVVQNKVGEIDGDRNDYMQIDIVIVDLLLSEIFKNLFLLLFDIFGE